MWSFAQKKKPSPHGLTLRAERLELRPASVGDYPAWLEVRGRNRDYLKPYEPAWLAQCLTPEFFRRRVETLSHEWLAGRTYSFLIFKDGALVGGININNVIRGAAQYASLGYWLDENAQGTGVMTEAGRVVLDYAFGPLALMRVNAATLIHNHKSMALLRRLGFEEEGFAKAYIQIDGTYQDHVLFGLPRADYFTHALQ